MTRASVEQLAFIVFVCDTTDNGGIIQHINKWIN